MNSPEPFSLKKFKLQETRSEMSEDREPLVEVPPNPELGLMVVAPAYNEYQRGSIFRFLESYATQTADSKKFEIICLVNNSVEAAEQQKPGYADNQKFIAIAEYLSNQRSDIPESLNAYRRDVIEKVKQKGVVFHVVDATSGMEINIGKIRRTITDEAIERARQTNMGLDLPILQMDTDTIGGPRFVEKVIHLFETQPDIDSAFLNIDFFIPEGTPELFQSSFAFQYQFSYSFCERLMMNAQNVSSGGPQIVARARAYEKVGGVPQVKSGEDTLLSANLSAKTTYYLPDIWVHSEDRARSESFLGAKRAQYLGKFTEAKNHYRNQERFLLKCLYQELLQLREQKITDENREQGVQQIITVLESYGMNVDREDLQKKALKTDNFNGLLQTYLREKHFPHHVSKSPEHIQEIVEVFKQKLSSEEYVVFQEEIEKGCLVSKRDLEHKRSYCTTAIELAWQNKAISQHITPEDIALDTQFVEFIEVNPWFLKYINDLISQHSSKEACIQEMRNTFPDYIENFDQTLFRKPMAMLHGVTRFVRRVRNSPKQFPTAMAFFQKVSS